ncbi:MAG TPA: hypothetical protein VLQ48_07975 [Chloroflexia bacterium]|nr:hypothetical protein [Chloroflexia bacterium]
MQLNLDDDEVAALLNVLSSYIPELREEIGKTESYDMREDLKAQKQTLNGIVTKLEASATGGREPNVGTEHPPR